jgi:hypothetical protein
MMYILSSALEPVNNFSEVIMSFSFICLWLLSLLPHGNECNSEFLRDARRVYRQNLRTTECALLDTKERFECWQEGNDGVYVSMSEEGRNLLIAYIDALEWYIELRPNVAQERMEKLKFLVNLLFDFPPRTPFQTCCPRPIQSGGFFIECTLINN